MVRISDNSPDWNKAKHFLLVNHTTKIIHHHHHFPFIGPQISSILSVLNVVFTHRADATLFLEVECILFLLKLNK